MKAARTLPLFAVLALCGAHERTLTISNGADMATLNPHLDSSATVANISEITMASLVRWNRNNRPIPELALDIPTRDNGGVSADGLTITYHLRDTR